MSALQNVFITIRRLPLGAASAAAAAAAADRPNVSELKRHD